MFNDPTDDFVTWYAIVAVVVLTVLAFGMMIDGHRKLDNIKQALDDLPVDTVYYEAGCNHVGEFPHAGSTDSIISISVCAREEQ